MTNVNAMKFFDKSLVIFFIIIPNLPSFPIVFPNIILPNIGDAKWHNGEIRQSSEFIDKNRISVRFGFNLNLNWCQSRI